MENPKKPFWSGGLVPEPPIVGTPDPSIGQLFRNDFVVTSATVGNHASTLAAAPGYEPLVDVLRRAHDQAAYGKGKERHANGRPFVNQPMQDLIRLHGVGFATGQASKKSGEALGLPTKERQVAEILGAIVYLAGAVIAIESAQ